MNSRNRYSFLHLGSRMAHVAVCSFLTLACLQSLPCSAATKSRPDVIIVLTDDQGYGDLSCHDYAVTFTTKLKSGRTQLQTWFYDADGKEICGAYYVYVHRK